MAQELRLPSPREIEQLARLAGFDLAGIAPAGRQADFTRFQSWVDRQKHAEMRYLADHRAAVRADPSNLLPSVRSIICVAKNYNGPEPRSTDFSDPERAWIARYAWGDDYHRILKSGLERLAHSIQAIAGEFAWRAAVDTAPLLERSLARQAGLGWIAKNTCLINQSSGSWLFLGELLTNLPLEPNAAAPPDRCGTCTRCIDACPTAAIVPSPEGRFEIDSRLCISYLTIEHRGPVPSDLQPAIGRHVFGCDICQDVCPWNRRAPVTSEFAPREFAPPLERLAELTPEVFRDLFRPTPVERARYRGFLRNVAIAMGNSRSPALIEPLEKLTRNSDEFVAAQAAQSLETLKSQVESVPGRQPVPCHV